jgi:hypothetical protein
MEATGASEAVMRIDAVRLFSTSAVHTCLLTLLLLLLQILLLRSYASATLKDCLQIHFCSFIYNE